MAAQSPHLPLCAPCSVEYRLLHPVSRACFKASPPPNKSALNLFAALDYAVVLPPDGARLIPTGLALAITAPNVVGLIIPDYAMAAMGLLVGRGIKLIEGGDTDEIHLFCANRSRMQTLYIEPGDCLAQLLFLTTKPLTMTLVEDFTGGQIGSMLDSLSS